MRNSDPMRRLSGDFYSPEENEAMRSRRYRVTEIFGPTIQGEGALAGMPTIFIRLFGCDYRCSWCDSLHAVLPEHRRESREMPIGEILDYCRRLCEEPCLVTLSGGNPALFNCEPLIRAGQSAGYTFACETQGTRFPEWLWKLDHLVISPKPPSSGESPDLKLIRFELLQRLGGMKQGGRPEVSVKIVIFDEADLLFADEVRHLLNNAVPLYLSVGNDRTDPITAVGPLRDRLLDRYCWLAEQVLHRGWHDVRVLPQLHVLAWGNARGK